ncbi:hypothetical protein HDU67_008285 [Dinochytrium kinnereticum]|nr:hypothetical protein HDU67_008285 [Dinochytrium kinnereticum]
MKFIALAVLLLQLLVLVAATAIPSGDEKNIILVRRARQLTCRNDGKLKRTLDRLMPGCDPAKSKGFRSAHNCPGKNYLCVIDGKGVCGPKGNFPTAEGGECFL